MSKVHIWITQFALTQGIFEKEGSIESAKMVSVKEPNNIPSYYHKPYWHLSREEVLAHAEEMRKKKIASLQKSINKMKKLKFD